MATTINISGDTPIIDPNYRYKMPTVFGKVEGRGNGIKTVIVNVVDLALSLHREPGEVGKMFGCELGCQTTWDPATERSVCTGAHTNGTLQKIVHIYVEKFVLCPECRLPETDYKIKGDLIMHKCAGCGAREPVDNAHKLCNYILAQHKKSKKEGKKKDKDKKKEKEKKKEKGEEGEKKEKKEKKEKSSKKDKKDKKSKSADDDDSGSPKTPAEGAAHLEESIFGFANKDDSGLPPDDASDDDDAAIAGIENVSINDNDAMTAAVAATQAYLTANPTAAAGAIVEKVKNEQMASALKSFDKIHILLRACISPAFFKSGDVSKYAQALKIVINNNADLQRWCISSCEYLCKDAAATSFPLLLKQLYDEDVLDEETILLWAGAEERDEFVDKQVDEEARVKLHDQAKMFVEWLEEAEDESDDEE